jgi:hypothetical protein
MRIEPPVAKKLERLCPQVINFFFNSKKTLRDLSEKISRDLSEKARNLIPRRASQMKRFTSVIGVAALLVSAAAAQDWPNVRNFAAVYISSL